MRKILIAIACCLAWTSVIAAPSNAKLIVQAKESVTKKLKDPESARFRGVFVMRDSVCGEVNAKNSYGGYIGFKRFIAIAGLLVVLEEAWPGFEQMYIESCSKTPPKAKEPPPYYEESWKDLERDLTAPKMGES